MIDTAPGVDESGQQCLAKLAPGLPCDDNGKLVA